MKPNTIALTGIVLALLALAGALYPEIGAAAFPAKSSNIPNGVGAMFFSTIVFLTALLSLVVGFIAVRARALPILCAGVAMFGLAALRCVQPSAFPAFAIAVTIAYVLAFLVRRGRT